MATNQYDRIIQEASTRFSVEPAMIRAIIQAESGFNPSAGSSAGAQGLMQLMPATFAGTAQSGRNILNPRANILAGTEYYRRMLDQFGGNRRLALAAYNAGPGAVQRYGGMPPYGQTRTYVPRVMQYFGEAGGDSRTQPLGRMPVADIDRTTRVPTVEEIAALIPEGKKVNPKFIRRAKEIHHSTWDQPEAYQSFMVGLRREVPETVRVDHASRFAPAIQAAVASGQVDPGDMPSMEGLSGTGFRRVLNWGGRFGLRPDQWGGWQTNPQVMGGRHTEGSLHYAGRAVDFGVNRNTLPRILRAAQYALQNPGQFQEFLGPFNWHISGGQIRTGAAPGHGTHLHVAFR